MPQKVLPTPQPIINIDETENKAGMVTKACILEVEHKKDQHLQQFYVTNLGFDHVLLGYLWLSTFNPSIDWKNGIVHGETSLKMVANTWDRWREL